ncbi:MAG: FixH family protein [Bacteroidia bacterium]|nr:FixH family protein [Bacteroidia bacterium]HQV00011.1 FixH family protein [Bacteroidia bacterium]
MKFNWGHGVALAYIVFAASMIWFAVKASQQTYDLVDEHYYEKAVGYQEIISAQKNGQLEKLLINYLPENHSIVLTTDSNLTNLNGTLAFYKPDNATADFNLNFSIDSTGTVSIPLKQLAHGYWNINATWIAAGKTCYKEKRIFIE